MDYEKIGLFIANKRKEQNMTQKDLAEKLELTDRAVSRWERGLDISNLEDLSRILKTSVLELLHGEEVTDANQVVVEILKKEKKRLGLWKTLGIILINALSIIFLFLVICLYVMPRNSIIHPNEFTYSMVSPSMEPTLHVHDKIFTKKIPLQVIEVGNIITYASNDTPSNGYIVTHRVVRKEVNQDGKVTLYTKGDNNLYEDTGLVTEENFIGVFDYKIPFLGAIIPNQPIPRFLACCLFFEFLMGLLFDVIFGITYFKNR